MLSSIISTMLLASAANAAITPWKRDQKVWEAPPGSVVNTEVFFNRESTNIGTCTVDDVMDSVAAHCERGQCNASAWTISCGGHGPQTGSKFYITIEVGTASYQTWIRNGLIDGTRSALKAPGIVEAKKDMETIWGGCSTCPSTVNKITTYEFPGSISIVHRNGENGKVPDVLSFTVKNLNESNGRDFCEILWGIAGVVAPLVSKGTGGLLAVGAVSRKGF